MTQRDGLLLTSNRQIKPRERDKSVAEHDTHHRTQSKHLKRLVSIQLFKLKPTATHSGTLRQYQWLYQVRRQ